MSSLTSSFFSNFTATTTAPGIFGPLTTAFSIPDSCYNIAVQCVDDTCGWLEPFRTCGSDGAPTPAAECFPSGTGEPVGPYITSSADIIYGPATGCPGGWESIQGSRTVECCPSGYNLATPTNAEYLGQTSCTSDATQSITATVCGTGTDNTETVFAPDATVGSVWAKRILVVLDADVENESSSSRSTSVRSSGSASTVESSQTAEDTATAKGTGVTSRLPSASATASGAGRVGGGFAAVVVGLAAVMVFLA